MAKPADKKWIQKAIKRPGAFTAKAKKAGKSKDDDDEEKVDEELSAKQKKYQAFFAKALKKFGVKSPAELEGDKKKEFYDYVDANYEADNEAD